VSFYFKRRGAFDTSFIRGEGTAPRTVCEPLFGPEVLGMRDPPIRAVWITAGNPVAMLPDAELARDERLKAATSVQLKRWSLKILSADTFEGVLGKK
jgi:hypothetical protein